MRKNDNSTNIIPFPVQQGQPFAPVDSDLDSIKDRVSGMLKSRFSADVQFFRSQVPHAKNDGQTYKWDISDQESPYRHVTLSRKSPLSTKEADQVKEILASVYLPMARMQYRKAILDRYSEHVNSDKTPRIRRKSEVKDFTNADSMKSRSTIPQSKLKVPFKTMLLQSRSEERINRFAREMHEVVDHFAILSWNDIRSRIQSTDDLASLTDCTILIPNLCDLTFTEIAIVCDYMKQSAKGPWILIGINSPIESMQTRLHLRPEFIKALSEYKIAVDRLPVHQMNYRELLELFI